MNCHWITIIVGLLCAILGYLLGKYCAKYCKDHCNKDKKQEDKDQNDEYNLRIVTLEERIRDLEKDKSKLEEKLKKCKENKTKLESLKHSNTSSNQSNINTGLGIAAATAGVKNITAEKERDIDIAKQDLSNFDKKKASAIFGKNIKFNDLKIVEGIGPKIASLFVQNGIKSWRSLSQTSIADCRGILKDGGKRYEMHQPDTWPKQAQMALEGKWEELLKWQDELDGGKEVKKPDTPKS